MVVKAEKTRTSETKPGNIYDAFAKQMLGQIVVFADFLQNYADPLFVKEIDLDNIQSAPTHYFGKGGTEQIVDLIFQCPLKNKNGGSLMAVVIFEHQSGSLKKIPRKLLRYISAIWDAETKEGKKVLSAPYFIVLRTGKKPHRGRLPKVSDSLPKGSDGKPLGKTVEIEYDVVDLPAWDFNELVGGTLVRLVLGMLHKMAGGNLDEFTEALKPLLEITDATQRIDLAKDVMPFVAKVFAANDRRLDEAQIDEILKPIFKGKERAMIKTVFEEREEVAEARGQAKGETITWRKAVLAALHGKFGKVPKGIEKMVQSMSDPIALESLVVRVGQCKTLDEFATDL